MLAVHRQHDLFQEIKCQLCVEKQDVISRDSGQIWTRNLGSLVDGTDGEWTKSEAGLIWSHTCNIYKDMVGRKQKVENGGWKVCLSN